MGHVNINIMGIPVNNAENRKTIFTLSADMTLDQLMNNLIKEHFIHEPNLQIFTISNWEDYLLLLVNGKIAKPNTLIQDGDIITITPMFTGG